jgi:uncharacterized membrane protein
VCPQPEGNFKRRISVNYYTSAKLTLATLLGTAVAMSQPDQFTFRSIDVPGAAATRAFGISPDGDIVGNYNVGALVHSYVMSKGVFTTVDPPYGISGTSGAYGINPRGEIVGLYADDGTVAGADARRTRGYLLDTSGKFHRIDFPGAENTLAIRISPNGQVVGCYHHQDKDWDVAGGGTMHGYVYQNGDYRSFPVTGSMHNGIVRDGGLIVGVVWPTQADSHAYTVENGVYMLLDLPNYITSSFAWDVNPSGEIVGYLIDASNRNHGFLLNKTGFTQIDFPGNDVVFTRAIGINSRGDVVGVYTTLDSADASHTHGFIASRRP